MCAGRVRLRPEGEVITFRNPMKFAAEGKSSSDQAE